MRGVGNEIPHPSGRFAYRLGWTASPLDGDIHTCFGGNVVEKATGVNSVLASCLVFQVLVGQAALGFLLQVNGLELFIYEFFYMILIDCIFILLKDRDLE